MWLSRRVRSLSGTLCTISRIPYRVLDLRKRALARRGGARAERTVVLGLSSCRSTCTDAGSLQSLVTRDQGHSWSLGHCIHHLSNIGRPQAMLSGAKSTRTRSAGEGVRSQVRRSLEREEVPQPAWRIRGAEAPAAEDGGGREARTTASRAEEGESQSKPFAGSSCFGSEKRCDQ